MCHQFPRTLLLIFLCVTIPTILFCQTDSVRNRGIPPAKQKEKVLWGNTYALVVGISSYKNLEQLNYADDDARSIRDYFLDSKIVRRENMYDLIDSNATRSAVFADLNKIYSKIRPDSNDRVVIYFAGHGDNESITGQGYLLAYDCEKASYASSDAIFIPQLESVVNALAAKAKVILITDACRSGNLSGQKAGALLTMRMLNTGFANVTKILSCEEDQLSQEKYFPGGGHGVFTYYLLEALDGLCVSDSTKYIPLSRIEDFIKNKVYENTKEQQRPVVVGPSSEIITVVVPELRQAMIASNRNGYDVAVNKRAVSEKKINISASDSVYYNLFYEQLRAHQLNTPKGDNAYETYQIAKKKITNADLLNSMKYDLAAKLEDAVQPLLNQFIRGEFQDYPDSLFNDANEKLKIVQNELIDSSDFRYNEIKAKRIFFIASVYKTPLALQLLHEADSLMPNTAFINFEIGRYYSENGNSIDSALKYFNRAILLSPRWSYPKLMIGNIYYHNKEYERAQSFFLQAIDLQPKFAYALFNLAMTYKQLKQKDSANYYYQQAVTLDKSFEQTWTGERKSEDGIVSLGKQVRNTEMKDESMLVGLLPPGLTKQVLNQEANSEVNEAYDFYYRAYTNSQKGNTDSANYLYKRSIELFEKAQAEKKMPFSYLYTWGYEYQSIGNNEKAKEVYKLGLKTDTTDFYLYDFGIAWIEDKEGHTEDALHWYQKAFEYNPQYYQAANNIGWIYARMKQYDSAVTYYQKALQLKPDFTTTISNLGNVYFDEYKDDSAIFYYKELNRLLPQPDANAYNRIGLSYYSLNSFDSAITYYNKAIQLNDRQPYFFRNRGDAYYENKEYQKAIDDYEYSNTKFPDSTKEYFNLALCYAYLKNYNKAAGIYKQSIAKEKITTDLYLRYYNLGWIMNIQGKLREALHWYMKAVDANPQYLNSLNNVAYTYDKLSRSDSAIYWYKRALKIDPTYTRSIYNLASIYNDLYKYDSSLAYYKMLLPLLPTDASVPYEIGQLYYYKARNDSIDHKSNFDSAIVYFEKAIQLDPAKADYWSKAGDTYLDIPKPTRQDTIEFYQKASERYKKAISLDSTQFLSMNRLGVCYTYLERYKEAIDIFEQALKKDILYKSIYEYNLGYIYDRIPKKDSAIYWYKKTLTTDPSYTSALYNIAIIYYGQFKDDSALLYYKMLLPLEPSDAWVPYQIGQIYYYKAALDSVKIDAYYDSAIIYFEKAIQINPATAEYQSKAGDAYYFAAKTPKHFDDPDFYRKAIDHYEKAIELKPEVAIYQSKAGDAYFYAAAIPKYLDDPGFYQKAVDHYKKALQLDNTQFLSMNNLGVSYISLKKYKEGIEIFEEALKKDTANKNLYDYNLACIYSNQRVNDKALDYFEKSVNAGYTDLAHISEDTDLDNIRSLPEFKTIIEKYFKADEINKYPGLFKQKN
ncbi:MAG TPA: tetratricopeptide repeat protein [Chitinophagaceae bacterium]|nr:tetratricopeptide repeat protein [Chitinophagaceae bacterium]